MCGFALLARNVMWGRGCRADWFFMHGENSEVSERGARSLAALGTPVDTDQRGFMRDLARWSSEAAKFLARQADIGPAGPEEKPWQEAVVGRPAGEGRRLVVAGDRLAAADS